MDNANLRRLSRLSLAGAVGFTAALCLNALVEVELLDHPRPFRRHAAPLAQATLNPGALGRVLGLPAGAPPPRAEPPPLHASLLGTLLSTNPFWSRASVQDGSTGRTVTLSVGDPLQGHRVAAISRGRIELEWGETRTVLEVGARPAAAGGPPRAPRTATREPDVRAISEREFEVSRRELDLSRPRMFDLTASAHLIPAVEGDHVIGFRVISIRPGSLCEKLGAQNGDVIRRVNGVEANSPERLLAIFSALPRWSRVEVELERGGSRLTHTYRIVEP